MQACMHNLGETDSVSVSDSGSCVSMCVRICKKPKAMCVRKKLENPDMESVFEQDNKGSV